MEDFLAMMMEHAGPAQPQGTCAVCGQKVKAPSPGQRAYRKCFGCRTKPAPGEVECRIAGCSALCKEEYGKCWAHRKTVEVPARGEAGLVDVLRLLLAPAAKEVADAWMAEKIAKITGLPEDQQQVVVEKLRSRQQPPSFC